MYGVQLTDDFQLRQMVFVAVVNFTDEDNTLVRQCGNNTAEVKGLVEIQRRCRIDSSRCGLRLGVVLKGLDPSPVWIRA